MSKKNDTKWKKKIITEIKGKLKNGPLQENEEHTYVLAEQGIKE